MIILSTEVKNKKIIGKNMNSGTKIEIAPDNIEDVEAFDELLRGIYSEYSHRPDERLTALNDLAMSTTVESGEILADAALRTILEDTDTPQAPSRRRAFDILGQQSGGGSTSRSDTGSTTTYELIYDENNTLINVGILTRLPEDKASTKAGHKLVVRIPSGPKKNNTSFRIDKKAV